MLSLQAWLQVSVAAGERWQLSVSIQNRLHRTILSTDFNVGWLQGFTFLWGANSCKIEANADSKPSTYLKAIPTISNPSEWVKFHGLNSSSDRLGEFLDPSDSAKQAFRRLFAFRLQNCANVSWSFRFEISVQLYMFGMSMWFASSCIHFRNGRSLASRMLTCVFICDI